MLEQNNEIVALNTTYLLHFFYAHIYPHMKTKASLYFDEAVQFLDNHLPSFKLSDLALDLNCSLQTIREIRKGKRHIDVEKIDVLYRKYGINPMFFHGHKPITLSGTYAAEKAMVSEPSAQYQSKLQMCEKEKELLQKMIADKDKMIALLEKKK